MNYVCRKPSIEDMNIKWDYEINNATDDKYNWITWKKEAIERFKNGKTIPYYGYLDGKIICEVTAVIDRSVIKNSEDLIDDKTAYLFAFRTVDEYIGKGYFSKLFKYMINDLKRLGYERVTIGVEPNEIKNKEIYKHLGFDTFIKKDKDIYPDGTAIDVEFYSMNLH